MVHESGARHPKRKTEKVAGTFSAVFTFGWHFTRPDSQRVNDRGHIRLASFQDHCDKQSFHISRNSNNDRCDNESVPRLKDQDREKSHEKRDAP